MMQRPRGYALPLVLLVLAIVALAVAGISYVVEAGTAEAGRITGEIRGRAACDSIVSLAGALTERRLRNRPATGAEALLDAVCADAGGCREGEEGRRLPDRLAPDGVELLDFFIGPVTDLPTGQRAIVAGQLAGLMADERLLSVFVRARDTRSGRECLAEEYLALAAVSPLQFDAFVETEATWSPASPRAFTRLHHNDALRIRDVSVEAISDGDEEPLKTAADPPAMQGHNDTPETMRWLLDPPQRDDPPEVAERRLANLADIRIIDGVWYLRIEGLPWPGKAIWSDHPGRGVTHDGAAARIVQSPTQIGQEDLYPSSARPHRYSYYETNGAEKLRDVESIPSILSYGALLATGGGVVPALWPSYDAVGASICGSDAFQSANACGVGAEDYARALAEATRGGFEHDGKNVLPVNFDVAALTLALQDRSVGELGDQLAGRGTAFNGIVWITQTWTNSDGGLGAGVSVPGAVPVQGAMATVPAGAPVPACDLPRGGAGGRDGGPHRHHGHHGGGGSPSVTPPAPAPMACTAPTLPTGALPLSQGQLPQPVCSRSHTDYASVVGGVGFTHAGCDEFGTEGGDGARPNAVRIVQAANIDPTFYPRGLTIATNLPLYVQGHVNNASVADARRKVLLAGDRVTLLSEQFRDDSRPWNSSAPLGVAGASVVMASLLTGIPARGDVEQAVTAAEDWRPGYAVVRGSLVVGFNSVFDIEEHTTIDVGLDLQHDEQLRSPLIQPPGVPRLEVGVTGRWRR